MENKFKINPVILRDGYKVKIDNQVIEITKPFMQNDKVVTESKSFVNGVECAEGYLENLTPLQVKDLSIANVILLDDESKTAFYKKFYGAKESPVVDGSKEIAELKSSNKELQASLDKATKEIAELKSSNKESKK